MDPTLDLLSWRAHLANAPGLPAADVVLRTANRHVAQASDEAVALARAVSEIVEGFSPQWKHMRGRYAQDHHSVARAMDESERSSAARSARQPNTMTLAQEELRAFATRFAGQLAGKRPLTPYDPHHLHQMAEAGRASRAHAQGVTADVRALHALLAGEDTGTGTGTDGDALLSRLDSWCSRLGRLDVQAVAAFPLPDQICALAVFNLRRFLRETADLSAEPAGSIAMLQSAAQFDSFGLGPYFRNVGTLARFSLDVFEMGHVAADAAAQAGYAVSAELWVALLARSLPGPLLCEVVDDLGDMDARAALKVVLARVMSNPDAIDIDMVMRLRDIALDNLDHETAACAQRCVCAVRPGNVLELSILGSIHAALGNMGAAEQVLEEALKYAPGDKDLEERLSALRQYRFHPYLLLHGFGSPEDRRHTRMSRRSNRLQVAPAPAVNIASVEFTF